MGLKLRILMQGSSVSGGTVVPSSRCSARAVCEVFAVAPGPAFAICVIGQASYLEALGNVIHWSAPPDDYYTLPGNVPWATAYFVEATPDDKTVTLTTDQFSAGDYVIVKHGVFGTVPTGLVRDRLYYVAWHSDTTYKLQQYKNGPDVIVTDIGDGEAYLEIWFSDFPQYVKSLTVSEVFVSGNTVNAPAVDPEAIEDELGYPLLDESGELLEVE